jgi:lipoprotein NlpI
MGNRINACLRVLLLIASASFSPVNAQQNAESSGVREIALAAESFAKGAPIPAWVEPVLEVPASELSGPAVILLADSQMLADDDPAFFVHRAVAANTPLSLGNIARFRIEFNPEYQRVALHSLRIRREGQWLDRLATSKVTFLQREIGLDAGVYTGNVTASVLISDLRVGDVLEYRYTVRGSNPVLGHKFAHVTGWDQEWATELRRITLWVPRSREVKWRMEGADFKGTVEPEEADVGALHRLRWQATRLPRFEVDKGIPTGFIPFRYIRFSEFRDWADVAGWAELLFATPRSESPAMAEVISRLKQKSTAEERASAALSWVQSEIRYVSLSLGESSHRPATPTITLERRYGDCKDKSALLVYLLNEMGIAASPVLVSSSHLRGLSRQLPSPFLFDHVIVQAEVDGKLQFLDPTRLGQAGRLAAMGQVWELADVLVVKHGSNELVQIKSEMSALTTDTLEERLRLPAFGVAGELSARRIWTGTMAEFIRIGASEVSGERLAKILLEPYERRTPGFQLVGKIRLTDDKQNNRISASYDIRIPVPAASTEDRWTVNYEASNIQGVLQFPESSSRTQPLGLPYRSAFRYVLDIDFPEKVSVTSDPARNEFRGAGVHVSRSSSFRGNHASFRLDVAVTEPQVNPSQIAQYVSTIRSLRAVERNSFWVSKSFMKQSEQSGASEKSLPQLFEERVAASLDRANKALGSGRLQGEDLATAYCERGRLYAIKGETDKALADLEKALSMRSADSPALQGCRGTVLRYMNELKESISAFSQAIVMDPRNGQAYFGRGITRFYDGQLRMAAEDFANAAKGGTRNAQFSRLWQAFALRRLGEDADSQTKTFTAANARAEWPAPAIAMMYEQISPEDVLKLVNEKYGQDRDMTLVEAYHAIAQWHLVHGDNVRAGEYFQKAVDLGALTYYEHQSSLRALKELTGR